LYQYSTARSPFPSMASLLEQAKGHSELLVQRAVSIAGETIAEEETRIADIVAAAEEKRTKADADPDFPNFKEKEKEREANLSNRERNLSSEFVMNKVPRSVLNLGDKVTMVSNYANETKSVELKAVIRSVRTDDSKKLEELVDLALNPLEKNFEEGDRDLQTLRNSEMRPQKLRNMRGHTVNLLQQPRGPCRKKHADGRIALGLEIINDNTTWVQKLQQHNQGMAFMEKITSDMVEGERNFNEESKLQQAEAVKQIQLCKNALSVEETVQEWHRRYGLFTAWRKLVLISAAKKKKKKAAEEAKALEDAMAQNFADWLIANSKGNEAEDEIGQRRSEYTEWEESQRKHDDLLPVEVSRCVINLCLAENLLASQKQLTDWVPGAQQVVRARLEGSIKEIQDGAWDAAQCVRDLHTMLISAIDQESAQFCKQAEEANKRIHDLEARVLRRNNLGRDTTDLDREIEDLKTECNGMQVLWMKSFKRKEKVEEARVKWNLLVKTDYGDEITGQENVSATEYKIGNKEEMRMQDIFDTALPGQVAYDATIRQAEQNFNAHQLEIKKNQKAIANGAEPSGSGGRDARAELVRWEIEFVRNDEKLNEISDALGE